MKQFSNKSINGAAVPCAEAMLETVPLLVRTIRQRMRSHNVADLTLVEFRALAFAANIQGATLSSLTEHIGLSMPSMSRIVDSLVQQRLLKRTTDPADRRCMALFLTAKGRHLYEAARRDTQNYLATRLTALDGPQCQAMMESLQLLRQLFAAPDPRIAECSSHARQ